MMGDCRAGHIQQGGDVQHTFLAVAEYPEDAQPGAVTQLLEYIGHSLEISVSPIFSCKKWQAVASSL